MGHDYSPSQHNLPPSPRFAGPPPMLHTSPSSRVDHPPLNTNYPPPSRPRTLPPPTPLTRPPPSYPPPSAPLPDLNLPPPSVPPPSLPYTASNHPSSSDYDNSSNAYYDYGSSEAAPAQHQPANYDYGVQDTSAADNSTNSYLPGYEANTSYEEPHYDNTGYNTAPYDSRPPAPKRADGGPGSLRSRLDTSHSTARQVSASSSTGHKIIMTFNAKVIILSPILRRNISTVYYLLYYSFIVELQDVLFMLLPYFLCSEPYSTMCLYTFPHLM